MREIGPLHILLSLSDECEKTLSDPKRSASSSDVLKEVQFTAHSIIALALDNIDLLKKPDQVTSSYITYLARTIKDPSQTH
jgi:hypothetical protein